jgi:hypothetical protein
MQKITWTGIFASILAVFPTLFLFIFLYIIYNNATMNLLALKFTDQEPLKPNELLKLYDYYGDKLRDREGNTILHRAVKGICCVQ